MANARIGAITLATRDKLAKLEEPDPFLYEMAMALARAMDAEPTSALAKELRAVVDLLTTPTNDGSTKLDGIFSGAEVGDPTHAGT